MICDGKGMIIGTELGLVWQPFPNLNIFMPFSFLEHHGESGMGRTAAGSTIHDLDIRSAEKLPLRFEYIVN